MHRFIDNFEESGLISNLVEMTQLGELGKTSAGDSRTEFVENSVARTLMALAPKGAGVLEKLMQNAKKEWDYDSYCMRLESFEISSTCVLGKLILDSKMPFDTDFGKLEAMRDLHQCGNIALPLLGKFVSNFEFGSRRSGIVRARKNGRSRQRSS